MQVPDATAAPHRTVEQFVEETAACSKARLLTGTMLHNGEQQPFLVFCAVGPFHASAMRALSTYLNETGADPIAATRVELHPGAT